METARKRKTEKDGGRADIQTETDIGKEKNSQTQDGDSYRETDIDKETGGGTDRRRQL